MQNLKEQSESKGSPSLIIKTMLLICSLLVVIAGIDKPHLSPFSTALETSGILMQLDGPCGSFFIDSMGERLLFTNRDGELVRVVLTTQTDLPITVAYGARLDGDHVLVHGVEQIEHGSFLSSESILEFDSNGDYLGVAERLEYGENDLVSSCQLPADDLIDLAFFPNQYGTGEISSIPYSFGFFATNLLYWISVLLVALFILFGVIHISKGHPIAVRSVALGSLAMLLVTVCYYSSKINDELERTFKNTIVRITVQSSTMLQSRDTDFLEQCVSDGLEEVLSTPEGQRRFDIIEEIFSSTRLLIAPEQSVNMSLFLIPDETTLQLLYDSSGIGKTGFVTTAAPEVFSVLTQHDSRTVSVQSSSVGNQLLDCSTIRNSSGVPIAYVVVRGSQSNLLAKQQNVLLNQIITLLAIYIGIVVTLIVITTSVESLRQSKEREKDDHAGKAGDLSGVYSLVYGLVSGADAVLVVYIAASICADYDLEQQTLLVALPISVASAGLWLGDVLAVPVIRILGKRKTGVISCVLGILCALLMIYSISVSSIFLYTLSRGINSVAIGGICYSLVSLLPYELDDPVDQKRALNNSSQCSTAAGILTALLGGIISEYAGFSTIYLFSAVGCAILLLITLFVFDDSCENQEEPSGSGQDSSSALEIWTLFLKPEMLMYLLFFIFPCTLTAGYHSFLFPLYSASAGVSAMLLSNLSVFSKTLVFFTNEPLSKLAALRGSAWSLLVPQLLICVGLVCFLLSPNLIWAIIMFFVCDVLKNLSTKESGLYRSDIAEKYNMDAGLVQSDYYIISSALNTLQSPILTGFLSFGMNLACAAVGSVCAVLFSVFGIYYKKQDPRLEHSSPPDASP